jgi:hypothetical protein
MGMKRLLALLSVGLWFVSAPLVLSAQTVPVTFEGNFMIGDRPTMMSGSIIVWTVRSVSNVSQCGETKIAAGGHYRVSVRDVPACTNAGNGGKSVTYVFSWNGEQVGSRQLSVDPKVFSTWNQTYQIDLVLGSVPSTVMPAPQAALLLRRFHGKVLIGVKPAPAGSLVTLYMGQGDGRVKCGEGQTGDSGFYLLDVARDAHCESSSRAHYEFMYKDQLAGVFEGAIPPDPIQLGIPLALDLKVAASASR